MKKYKENNNMKNNNEKYYIVRGDRSGVFAGNIKERNGKEVLMNNVRRLWYWDGASSISQLAKEGTVNPNNCKFSVVVDEVLVLDAIEIDTCSKESEKSIKGVKEWKR